MNTLRSVEQTFEQPSASLGRLRDWIAQQDMTPFSETTISHGFNSLCADGLDAFPRPGHGHTLLRWQLLAELAALDLCFVKIVEAHTDALAILADLNASAPSGSRLGIWASEPPDARLRFSNRDGRCRIDGRKSWCSGAWSVSHALVTGWDESGEQRLALVALDQRQIRLTREGWSAVGMMATQSVDVEFQGADASWVGGARAYLDRPGFWHGAIGIAACWYGAAVALAEQLRAHVAVRPDVHAQVNLGAIDVALGGARAALREAAANIDALPNEPRIVDALRIRAIVEDAATATMHHCGRALGATPFCRDANFARRMADLPVFLRQNHAERDLASLAKQIIDSGPDIWVL